MFNFIFITGAGRCGTHLITGLLDGNNQVDAIPGEPTNFFGQVLNYNGLSQNINLDLSGKILSEIVTEVFANDNDYKNIVERVEKKISSFKEKNIKSLTANDFLSSICQAIFIKENGTAVINLQNENISCLINAFPNCKVIHMLRNPLTQLNSRYLFRYRIPNNYKEGEFGKAFFRNYNSFTQAQIFENSKQVKIIRMEDLVNNTSETIEKICSFLDITNLPVNLKPSARGKIFKSTFNTINIKTDKVLPLNQDWSSLSPNDLYYCSQIKVARKFYDFPKYPKVKNNYIFFLIRHLGFYGKNRVKVYNPFRLFKLLLGSIYLFIQDTKFKNDFDTYLEQLNKNN